MKLLKYPGIALIAMSLAACASNPVKEIDNNSLYCVVSLDSGEQYVYRTSEAIKYADEDGNLPACHVLHQAKTNPGAETLSQKVQHTSVYLKKLEARVSHIEKLQKELDKQQKANK